MLLVAFLASLVAANASASSSTDQASPRILNVSTESLPAKSEISDVVSLPSKSTGQIVVQVLEAFRESKTTRMILQSNVPLIVGQDVFIGVDETPVNVGTFLSKTAGFHYYAASVMGKVDIMAGDLGILEPTKKKFSVLDTLAENLTERRLYAQKLQGEVLAVHGNRVMIDKGTLQEVHERDMYEVYGKDGRYKGMLEIRGIGDLQSSGRIHRRWKDRRSSSVYETGDQVRFVGQRMKLAIGAFGGFRPYKTALEYAYESSTALGALVTISFRKGWGLEMAAGYFQRKGKSTETLILPLPGFGGATMPAYNIQRVTVDYIAPIWVKKNFYYSSWASPFMAAGLSYVDVRNTYIRERHALTGEPWLEERKRKQTVAPMVGAGLELFPTRTIRPRMDIRYFHGPTVTALHHDYDASVLFVSGGVLIAW